MLTGLLHDQKLDLDSIRFDRERGEVKIAVQVRGVHYSPVFSCVGVNLWHDLVFAGELRITGVLDFRLTDEAQIGVANIDEVLAFNGRLIITSGLPVRLEFSVSRVEIELVVSDRVVGKHRLVTFGKPPEQPAQPPSS